MSTRHYTPRADVILVPLGDQHALIDPRGEQVYVLNAAAAELWQALGADPRCGSEPLPLLSPACGGSESDAAVDAFLAELVERGLVVAGAAPPAGGERLGALPLSGRPAIIAQAPLQVAANTCNDPFKTMW